MAFQDIDIAEGTGSAEWDEQVKNAKDVSSMTPEELLGFSFEPKEEPQKPVFSGSTSKSLYKRMMDNQTKKEETEDVVASIASVFGTNNEQSSEEAFESDDDGEEISSFDGEDGITVKSFDDEDEVEVIKAEEPTYNTDDAEPEVCEEPKDEGPVVLKVKEAEDGKVDEFADFFKSLDSEPEVKPEPEKEEPTVNEKENDDIMRILMGVVESNSTDKAVESAAAIIKETVSFEQQEEEVKTFSFTSEPEETGEAEDLGATRIIDIKSDTAPEIEDIGATKVIDAEAVAVAAAIEDVADISESRSIYGSDYKIDNKAIENFFAGTADTIEDIKVPKSVIRKSKKEEPTVQDEPIEEESPFSVFEDDVDDYKNIDNGAEIKEQLLTRRKRITLRLLLTSIITALMLAVKVWFTASNIVSDMPLYIDLILTVLLIIVNYRSFIGMFVGDIDLDFCSSVTGGIVLIESALAVFLFGGVGAGLGIIAGFAFLLSLIGKAATCSATIKGLCLIATNEDKRAVTFSTDQKIASDIASGSVDGDTCVGFGKKTVNVGGFLKNWYKKTPADKFAGKLVFISAVVSIVVALTAALLMNIEIGEIASVFTVTFGLCCAPTAYLICSLPAKRMVNGLKMCGATVFGLNGANALKNCNTVALSAGDLFPDGSIILQNMMPLSANSVDKSIAKAAALANAVNSPLAPIFDKIVKTDEEIKVDSVKYENKLGISGWVNDENILIGSRTLMENHNVKTPSQEFDKKILAAGYKPVYLACGGKPCILFVVQYTADESVKFELDRLLNTGTTVVVDSCDPNITKKFLCDCFDLLDDDMFIMSQSGSGKLNAASEFCENTNGFAAYKGSGIGLLSSVSASIRVSSIVKLLTALHIIGIVLSIGLLGLITVTANELPSSIGLISVGFEAVFAIIVAIVSFIKRP